MYNYLVRSLSIEIEPFDLDPTKLTQRRIEWPVAD